MSTLTPNYDFNLPLVNDPIDADLWGYQFNANWSSLDTTLKTVSDTATAASAYVDVGDMKVTARDTAPAKWLLCYGQAIDRTTYSNLFAAIGIIYGAGDGSTTFNVPDMRGRVAVGKDDMGGSAANRITNAIAGFVGTQIGASGGSQSMQQHTHTVNDPGHTHSLNGTPTYGFSASGGGSGFLLNSPSNVGSANTGITLADTGAGASQNVQPSLVLNWLIYAGV